MVYKLLKIVIETRKILLAMCYSQKQSPELFYAFSCEFYEISKNTFFTKHLRTTVSILWSLLTVKMIMNMELFFNPLMQNVPKLSGTL